ncbi:MAG: DNA-processing protein DprA, partial [Candidatus Levybacteria bacterium]|nr:DNA-processing protein DprA [Candidatus Levybacteria bacterium]
LAFSVSNLGPKTFQRVLNGFATLEKAWNGTKEEYQKLGIEKLTYKKFDEFRKSFDIEKYVLGLEKSKVSFVSILDKQYPDSLKKLDNPPIGLFCKGNIDLLRHSEFISESQKIPDRVRDDINLKIAVVGTRKVTQYGKNVTEALVVELVQNGICIVSGLALGVDGVAHRTAVLNKGLTIAVLACGVDCCLPSENYSLYSNILENDGMIMSEYPLSQPPNKGTFLARNRIIAALSDGVLVTEAAEDSGSLVTADWGLKLGKKVFAVPGPITSRMSDGSLKLLKSGATLVSTANDILREFSISNSQFSNKSKIEKLKLSKEERKIVRLLENEQLTIDEIAKKTKLPVSKLFICLSNLELKAIIKNNQGEFALLAL